MVPNGFSPLCHLPVVTGEGQVTMQGLVGVYDLYHWAECSCHWSHHAASQKHELHGMAVVDQPEPAVQQPN